MQYREGWLGRVFIAKIDNGDNLLDCIKQLAENEGINTAVFLMVGALKGASFVAGPKEPVLPPDQVWKKFDDGREIVGTGTLFTGDGEPVLHIHAGIGKGDQGLVGCIRENAEAYVVVEVVMLEIKGIEAVKDFDRETGLKILKFLDA